MRRSTFSAQALSFSFLLACLAAQQPPEVARGYGLAAAPGSVRGLGRDYSARFDERGLHFTPALGARVDAPATVHLRFDHVRRGALRVFERRGDVTPTTDERQVRYQHGPQLTELYDVRADGVEQSFVFAERPAGTGDLVVAVRITPDLTLATAHPSDVRYEQPGAGGVSFGAVTGIDHDGARAAGSMRVVGDQLELSLPAAFVDSAAYPLVLDPMIGSVVTLGNGTAGIDRQPSVAFDETTQRYLLVWNVEVSATDAEVWAQFVTVLGNPIGNPILVDGNARTGLRPAVANVNDSDRFLLVWGRAALQGSTPYTQARYAAMTASNGALSASTYFAGNTTTVPTGLAVGGDARESTVATYDRALVVATLSSVAPATPNSTAYVWPVGVPATGNPTASSLTLLYSEAAHGALNHPAITKHAGSGGRYMITLVRLPGLVSYVEASLVTQSGTICHQTTVATAIGVGHTSVATRDGFQFLVAHDDIGGNISTYRYDYAGACGTAATLVAGPVDPVQATGFFFKPEVDCARDKYVLSWEQSATSGGSRDVKVRGLSLVDGTPAGASHYAFATPSFVGETGSAIATRWSGGDTTSDEALVAWSSGVIVGRRFEATGTGTVTSLGGACGITGLTDYATYGGTPALGTTFSIELLAPTAPVLALIVGFSQSPFACGPCTIVPSPDILLAGGGPVSVTVPLDPNLIDFSLYTQWLQWRSAGCGLLPSFGFSNTLRFTIGE